MIKDIKSKIAKRALISLGWKFPDTFPSGGPFICILYPHTTMSDTLIAFLFGTYVRQSFFIPVKESFDIPGISFLLRKLNLLTITRDRAGYEKIRNEMENTGAQPCIAIEGTRKLSNGIKPGFFNIAKALWG